jgi:anthranilate/para-aminobenzoate synthase component II
MTTVTLIDNYDSFTWNLGIAWAGLVLRSQCTATIR